MVVLTTVLLLLLLLLLLPLPLLLAHPDNDAQQQQQQQQREPPPPLAAFIGTQHFQPCYNVSLLPSLLDGAVQAARLGSTSFKFALKADMQSQYPYLNDGANAWPKPARISSLTDVLATPQLQALLRNQLKTNFDSYTLWVYRPGEADSPYCADKPLSPAQLAAETTEIAALTKALMALPPNEATGKTSYWIEAWENDWATRCGSYSAPNPPPLPVVAAFSAWLQARQDGVTQGRATFCRDRAGILREDQAVETNCNDPAAVVAAASVNVFNGAEVNLVGSCLTNMTCGNIVRAVLPHVALDYVSYSSYDTMRTPQLADALDLIRAQHNRTAASPERALFITEFGLPETSADPETVMAVVKNVLSIGRAKDLARVHYWQTINSEKLGGGNCANGPPIYDPAKQNGFWTTLPNGELSAVGQYLKRIISGVEPFPALPGA